MSGFDPADIRESVRKKYRDVAREAQGQFAYPVGWASAVGLGYRREWLDKVPAEIVDRFVGIGNPFGVRCPKPGERVLDVGCGCGMDTLIAGLLVGETGSAVGIDLTPEMLDPARRSGHAPHIRFEEASVDELPFEDGSFDVVISNGVLNLVPDKDAAFREIARVLRPGGSFIAADLVVIETVPPELLCSMDAWST